MYELYELYGVVSDFLSFFGNPLDFLKSYSVVGFAIYIFHSFLRMKMGQIAGRESNWQAWIPFVQEYLLLKLAGFPMKKIFFFGSYYYLIVGAFSYALGFIGMKIAIDMFLGENNGAGVLFFLLFLLLAIFVIKGIVVRIKVYWALYERFNKLYGFQKVAAVLGGFLFNLFLIIADAIVVFDSYHCYNPPEQETAENKKEPEPEQPNPKEKIPQLPSKKFVSIRGLRGMYANQAIAIGDGDEIVFGRDPSCSNIVFGPTDTMISRKHCSVKYISSNDMYLLVVFSQNGVLINGQRLGANESRMLQRGTVISLGTEANSFLLE